MVQISSIQNILSIRNNGIKSDINGKSISIGAGEDLNLYFLANSTISAQDRIGQIRVMTQEFQTIGLDIMKTVGVSDIRSMSAISSLLVDVEFDTIGFIRNLLYSNIDSEFMKVLQLIRMDITTGAGYGVAVKRGTYNIEVPSDTGGIFPKREDIVPNFRFFDNFFLDEIDDETSLWDKYWENRQVYSTKTRTYHDRGYPEYNFVNDIYPEQTELLDYRWRQGGYDITRNEMKVMQTFVMKTFNKWYAPRSPSMVETDGYEPYEYTDFNYDAEERTVRYFTGIAKTDTYENFKKEENILINLLGPRHVIQWNDNGDPIRWGYGDISSENQDGGIWFTPTEWFDELHIEEDLPENSYTAIIFDKGDPTDYFPREETYYYDSMEISKYDAFFSTLYGGGKIFNKTVFDGAVGNEYRYAMPFREFLKEQNWTIDDFIEIYKVQIFKEFAQEGKSFEERIEEQLVKRSTFRPKDFCEFYDKNHPSPFDNISVFIPTLLTIGENNVVITRSHVTYDQNGAAIITVIGQETVVDGSVSLPFNKGEYISAITVNNALNVIMSEYMKINVSMTMINEITSTESLKFRLITSDYTYFEERRFVHRG